VLLWLFVFLIAGIAFGASAVFWWAHFNSEVDAIRTETSSFTDQVETAAGAIETQRTDALTEINRALDDLSRLTGATTAVITAGEHADNVWAVSTLDEDGVASVGSAFVVANEADRSLLLTALEPLRAATAEPGPEITLRSGDREMPAELWSWDEGLDLALLVVDDPNLPALEWAGEEEAAQALGSGVYALGGLGAEGAAASPGLVLDQSAVGIQHNAVVGAAYRGGPMMTGDDHVLAIASTAYRPLGFDPGAVLFAVPVGAACDSLLACSIEEAPVAGEEGGPALEGSDAPAADAGPAPAEGTGEAAPPDTE
jgi:S1-C subfamily serine protease